MTGTVPTGSNVGAAPSYQTFRTAYEEVMNACLTAKLHVDGLAAAIDRLTDLRGRLSTAADRANADTDIARLQEILDRASRIPFAASRAFNAAARALHSAMYDDGTVAERIERARLGIEQITQIASRADTAPERDDIKAMTVPLAMLLDALRLAPPESAT